MFVRVVISHHYMGSMYSNQMCLLLLSRTTLQSLYQATENARQNNYYVGGLSHTWMTFYQSQLTEDYLIRNEWYIYMYMNLV